MGKKKKSPNDMSQKELDYINKYKKYLTSFKTYKTSLKSIVKNKNTLTHINDIVLNVNKIRIHTYHFIKLFFLDSYFKYNRIPDLSVDMIESIMKLLCNKSSIKRDENVDEIMKDDDMNEIMDEVMADNYNKVNIQKRRGRPLSAIDDDENGEKLKAKLAKQQKDREIRDNDKNDTELFYDNVYKNLIADNFILSYKHLNTVLKYESQTIFTNFNNHIQLHFYDLFNRFVNISLYKDDVEDKIKATQGHSKFKDMQLRHYRNTLRRVKLDLLTWEDKCLPCYQSFKDDFRNNYLPYYDNERSLMTQIKDNPLSFLECLIKMSIKTESVNGKPINCFPLQKGIIPTHIRIDTVTLIHALLPNDHKKTDYLRNGNTNLFKEYLWSLLFKTNKKVFGGYNTNKYGTKKYVFNSQIMTDGVGCSILLIRKDLNKIGSKNFVPSMNKPFNYNPEKYVEDLLDEEKESLKDKTIIGIDPGKDDLIYAVNGKINDDYVVDFDKMEIIRTRKKAETFRYSQNQRRKELKTKRYRDIREVLKLEAGESSVHEIERHLTFTSSKSCDYKKTVEYIKTKNLTNYFLLSHYEKQIYRKLRLLSFMNKQSSEDKMIRNFKEKFGSSNNTVICIGDWEQRKQMKLKEPTIGKGMRNIFRRAGYETYLVYERNTSKYNFVTGEENEKFRWRKNPRPNQSKENSMRLQHGLLRSENVPNMEPAKHMLVNRDLNGAMNIRLKAYNIIHNLQQPIYLQC